jgi:hypothetical protein
MVAVESSVECRSLPGISIYKRMEEDRPNPIVKPPVLRVAIA